MSADNYASFLAAKRRAIQSLLAADATDSSSGLKGGTAHAFDSTTLGLSDIVSMPKPAPAAAPRPSAVGAPKQTAARNAPAPSTASSKGTALPSRLPAQSVTASRQIRPVPAPKQATGKTVPQGRVSKPISTSLHSQLQPTDTSFEVDDQHEEIGIYTSPAVPISTASFMTSSNASAGAPADDSRDHTLDDSAANHAPSTDFMAAAPSQRSHDSAAFHSLLRSSSPLQSPPRKTSTSMARRDVHNISDASDAHEYKEEHSGDAGDERDAFAIRNSSPLQQIAREYDEYRLESQPSPPAPALKEPRDDAPSTPVRKTITEPPPTSPSIRAFMDRLDRVDEFLTRSPPTRAKPPIPSNEPKAQPSIAIPSAASSGPVVTAVKAQVTAMQLEIDEKTRQVAILRAQLRQAQKVMAEQLEASQAAADRARTEDKKEFEASLAKHVGFIDTLMADKKALAQQVTALTDQLSLIASTTEKKIKMLVDQHQHELARARDQWEASDKARRQAWQQAQMKELRERTIKGLEPDIARMLERHKDEVARLQAAAEEQLAAAAARFEEEKAAAVRQAREHALDNGSEQVAREKDSWRAREAALRHELEREFQTIRVQLTREVDEERRRGLDQLRQENQKHMEEIYKIQQDCQSRINELTQNFNKEREAHARTVAEQVEEAKKKLQVEAERHEKQLQQRLRSEFEDREGEIRRDANRSRDEQVRIVIAKAEEDLADAKRKARYDMEQALTEQRNDMEAEIHELRDSIDGLEEKYRAACNSRDAALSNKSAEASRLGTLVEDSARELQRKNEEIARMQAALAASQELVLAHTRASELALDDLRKIHADELAALQAEISNSKLEKQQLEAKCSNEVASVKRSKAEELEAVETRVKAALKKRDELIASLRLQYEAEKAKAETATRLMVQQRRDLMGESIDFGTS